MDTPNQNTETPKTEQSDEKIWNTIDIKCQDLETKGYYLLQEFQRQSQEFLVLKGIYEKAKGEKVAREIQIEQQQIIIKQQEKTIEYFKEENSDPFKILLLTVDRRDAPANFLVL